MFSTDIPSCSGEQLWTIESRWTEFLPFFYMRKLQTDFFWFSFAALNAIQTNIDQIEAEGKKNVLIVVLRADSHRKSLVKANEKIRKTRRVSSFSESLVSSSTCRVQFEGTSSRFGQQNLHVLRTKFDLDDNERRCRNKTKLQSRFAKQRMCLFGIRWKRYFQKRNVRLDRINDRTEKQILCLVSIFRGRRTVRINRRLFLSSKTEDFFDIEKIHRFDFHLRLTATQRGSSWFLSSIVWNNITYRYFAYGLIDSMKTPWYFSYACDKAQFVRYSDAKPHGAFNFSDTFHLIDLQVCSTRTSTWNWRISLFDSILVSTFRWWWYSIRSSQLLYIVFHERHLDGSDK